MGSAEDDPSSFPNEQPQHRVALSPFLMACTPITRRLYAEVMGIEPPLGAQGDLPVTEVSRFDAIQFCNALSERVGLAPCYQTTAGQVSWDRSAPGYRLPTEAEWEYACRAGTTTRWSFGDDESMLGKYAWYRENSGGQAHPVATKQPNPWGLYDMHGNVWEWVFDSYQSDTYAARVDTLTTHPVVDKLVNIRILRGGSVISGPWLLRSAVRDWSRPGDRRRDFGFRCVRVSVRPLTS